MLVVHRERKSKHERCRNECIYVFDMRKVKRIMCISITHRRAILLFRVKVSVRSQADNHDKEAVGSQRQTGLAEHIPPPLASLHFGAPSRTPRALHFCCRTALIAVIRGAVVIFIVVAFHEALVVGRIRVTDLVIE